MAAAATMAKTDKEKIHKRIRKRNWVPLERWANIPCINVILF
jgi:hypothetical protein